MDTMQYMYIYIVSAYFVYLRANTGLGKRENERQVAGQFFFYRGSFGAESDGRTQRTQAIASKHTIVGGDNAMAWKDTHDTKTA